MSRASERPLMGEGANRPSGLAWLCSQVFRLACQVFGRVGCMSMRSRLVIFPFGIGFACVWATSQPLSVWIFFLR